MTRSLLLIAALTSPAWADTPAGPDVPPVLDGPIDPASNPPAEQDIRGIKPAIDLPTETVIWPWILGGATLASLATAGLWWSRRTSPLTPEQQLRAALTAAEEEPNVPLRADQITRALRRFIEHATPIEAMHLTTSELSAALASVLSVPVHESFTALFERCDTLRFSGASSGEPLSVPWIDAFVHDLTTPAEDEAPSTPDDIAAK